tara:strand:+ start:795 stop:1154 length:360 start_codon:yes stop_codon:yes gene_type:complete
MSDLIIWIIFGTIFAASVFVNVLLILYIRKTIVRVFVASEEASEILTRLDAFRTHLVSIYEMEMFYGDETLKSLINHLKELMEFILRYEEIYSFTQPDLLEQLDLATQEVGVEDESPQS